MNFNTYPSPADLRYFQEIAQTGNLSRAAERLGVGQPALSLSLKRLEEGLQTQLLIRRHRAFELTSAGQKLLQQSRQLLALWDDLISETKKTATELSGRFKIGCHPSVAIYALKDVMREIYVSYPGIEIQLVHQLSRVICEEVISGTIDFGLVVNAIQHPDLVIHPLAKDEVSFWKTVKGIDDVLIYNPNLLQSQALLKKIKKEKAFQRTLVSDNLEVITALAASGAGVAILPSRIASNSPKLKRLQDYPFFLDEIAMIHRSDLQSTASTKALKNRLKGLSI